MEKLVLIIHVLAASGVIGLVLLQHGKGADMGAAFGSGASGSLFGVSGSSNFMSRATAGFVAIFFCTSIVLGYMASHRGEGDSVVKSQLSELAKTQPANKKEEAKPALPASPVKDIPK